jgi:hypothetical protein
VISGETGLDEAGSGQGFAFGEISIGSTERQRWSFGVTYQITLTDGTILTTMSDGTLDNTTSLTLVAKNYAGYGTAIATDLVHLLENAANVFPPPAPLVGQFWYDTSFPNRPLMRVWNGTIWQAVDAVTSVVNYTGDISLAQMVTAGLAPSLSPTLTGIPLAPTAAIGTATMQLATTAFVQNSFANLAATAIPLMDSPSGSVGTSGLWAHGDHSHPTDTTLAPIASPTLTGIPSGPTAALGTATMQLATTAFVQNSFANLAATAMPLMDSPSGSVGTSGLWAHGDHSHPTDTTLAPLISPALVGIPTAPTAPLGTNTTQIATTAFATAAALARALTPGAQGPQGPPGPQGPAGPAGASAGSPTGFGELYTYTLGSFWYYYDNDPTVSNSDSLQPPSSIYGAGTVVSASVFAYEMVMQGYNTGNFGPSSGSWTIMSVPQYYQGFDNAGDGSGTLVPTLWWCIYALFQRTA